MFVILSKKKKIFEITVNILIRVRLTLSLL